MNISSVKQLPERAIIVAGYITRVVSGKPKLIIECGSQVAADLMQMTVLNAEWMQKKLVCCECFEGECRICGYKN
jgi:hypothetical protein